MISERTAFQLVAVMAILDALTAAPAAARDTLLSVNGQWTILIGFDAQTRAFEAGIVNGGSGAYADDRLVYQGRGYWLHMTEPGTLGAIGA